MDIELLENKPGDSSKTNSNKKKRRKAKEKRMETNGSQIMDQTCGDLEVSEKLRDCKRVADNLGKNLPETNLSVEPQLEYLETVVGSIESLPQVNTDTKRKKKRKRGKKVKSKDQVLSVEQNTMDTGATENLAEGNVSGKRRRKLRKKKAKSKNETQSTEQTDAMLNLHQEIEGKPIENEGEALKSEFSTRKEPPLTVSVPDMENLLSLCKDAETVDLLRSAESSSNRNSSRSGGVMSGPSLEPNNVGEFLPLEAQHGPSPNHMDGDNGNLSSGINEVNVECTAQESELSTIKESSLTDSGPDKVNFLNSCKDEETVDLSHGVEDLSNNVSSELGEDRSRPCLERMEMETKLFTLEILHIADPKPMDGENEASKINKTVVEEEKCSAEDHNALSICIVDVATDLSSENVKEAEFIVNDSGCDPRIAPPIICVKRMLIVLDVNGLLAHIVMPPPYDCTANAYMLGRAIFKRPFCDDFLKFCFEYFDVGVWSSRSKRIIDRVVDYLFGHFRNKLKFCWDMDHSTQTGFKTLENNHKPLVCKELSRIWENEDPNLPWKKGDYDESNTLLLDDSPYKALLNPLHTAIFPSSYHYHNIRDNSLGPGGDLRIYLEGLLRCDNVQKYVEQHPFGQSAINENNLSWGFYSGVLQTMTSRMENNNCDAIPPLSSL